MTDFRALCAELVDALQYHLEQTRPIKRTTEILTRARAALAQPKSSLLAGEPMKNLDEFTGIVAAVLVLLLIVVGAAWWYPQKWEACQRLYDNRPAQLFCLGSK